MDSVSVSPEEKKHRPEEHRSEEPVLETSPAPALHGGVYQVVSRTGLKRRCWRPTQHRLFMSVVRWVTEHELWFLAVALPPLWLPGVVSALVPLSFGILAALVLCRWAVTGRPVPSTPMNWPILVILLMLPVGLWASPIPEISWEVFCRILLGIALFYGLVGNASAERQIALVMAVSVLAGVAVALVGLLASDWQAEKLPFLTPLYHYLPRVSLPAFIAGRSDTQAGLFHPNMIGGTLAVLIPLDIGLLGWYTSALSQTEGDESNESPARVIVASVHLRKGALLALYAALVLMCGTLLLTQSRIGLLALVVTLCVWAAASHRWLWVVFPIGAAGFLLLARAWGVEAPTDLLLYLPVSDTWYARPKLWRAALESIGDYPFTGVGLGCFEPVVRHFYVICIPGRWQFGHSHNLLLQAGVDLGIAGMLSFAALLGIGLYCGWKAWKYQRGSARWLAGGVVAALLAYVLFGTANCLDLGSKPGFIFWIVLALLASLWKCEGRSMVAETVECRSLRGLCDEQA